MTGSAKSTFKTMLEPRGFKFLPDLNQYRRSTNYGFECILVTETAYDKELLVEIHIGVRHDELEKAMYQLTHGLFSFEADSMSFVTSLGRLSGKMFLRFQINNENQLALMQSFVSEYLEKSGFEFLDQLGDINFLEALYNGKPEDKQYFYNFFHKALRGLVLARYVDNPLYYEVKERYYNELLKNGYPAQDLDKFKKLAMVMNTYSMN
jgi:hypothetical protein